MADNTRDSQDGFERHVFGAMAYDASSGHTVSVKGTGTEDSDLPVLMGNTGFNLAKDTNAEVFALSGGFDTNNKFALVTIPRDMQRQWAEGRGGVQNPLDKNHALEFQKGRARLTGSENFGVGDKGIFEVKDGNVYIRGNLIVDKQATINGGTKSPSFGAGRETVPGYDNT